MFSEHALMHVAIILISCKLIASLSLRLKLPAVIGYVLFGILMGPMGLRVLEVDAVVSWLSKVGVIMLLFEAGLETEIAQMKRQGVLSLLVASGGVVLPFALGFGFCLLMAQSTATCAMVGIILTATSVGVTTMTLVELGKLRTPEGTIILAAAIIDDFIGIILLTVTIRLLGASGSLAMGLVEIGGYLGIAVLAGVFVFPLIVRLTRKLDVEHGVISVALAVAFLFAWGAEQVQAAEITGAYLAGLFFGRTTAKREVMEGIWSMGQAFFVCFFFVQIGLATRLSASSISWGFVGGIVLIAIVGKIIGCGLVTWIGGMSSRSGLCVGVGMIPRGEVALVMASLGMKMGIIKELEFSTAVIVVLVTAILPPAALKWAFGRMPDTQGRAPT